MLLFLGAAKFMESPKYHTITDQRKTTAWHQMSQMARDTAVHIVVINCYVTTFMVKKKKKHN